MWRIIRVYCLDKHMLTDVGTLPELFWRWITDFAYTYMV